MTLVNPPKQQSQKIRPLFGSKIKQIGSWNPSRSRGTDESVHATQDVALEPGASEELAVCLLKKSEKNTWRKNTWPNKQPDNIKNMRNHDYSTSTFVFFKIGRFGFRRCHPESVFRWGTSWIARPRGGWAPPGCKRWRPHWHPFGRKRGFCFEAQDDLW